MEAHSVKNRRLEPLQAYSVLDLAPINDGATAAHSFHNSLDLAQHAEAWGFHRYWLAEHHSMPGIASSATSVVISYIAGGTKTIRVGSGGVMLPNHAPLMIAEQFGTLESMYPGRIDLGLGRAPGTDLATTRALRRDLQQRGEDFPRLLQELQSYFQPPDNEQPSVRAVPGEGLHIPIWLLGSSGFSARLAAELGLPFAFASHFAPDYLLQALELYRNHFNPSPALAEPYVMIGVNAVVADSDEEARKLSTSQQLQFLNLVRQRPGGLMPPVEDLEDIWTPHEKMVIQSQLRYAAIGNPQTVSEKLSWILAETKANEIIFAGQIYDHQARLRSYELLSGIMKKEG